MPNSVMTSSAGLYSMERSNSAPGSPILQPIGPPNPAMVTKMVNTTSPGSEPEYRTGSSLSSGIGLSPGSGSNPMAGPGGLGRSLTPDNEIIKTAMMDKDLFVGTSGHRPASSGSANAAAGFMPGINPQNLLSAAAQMASMAGTGVFTASDLDYLTPAPPERPVDFHR